MRLKSGTNKCRGYAGWHTTWDDKSVYLRSMKEFIVACMLDSCKIPYLTEKHIYYLETKIYKPDFFLYEDNTYSKFYKIIEVKDPGDDHGRMMAETIYGPYFANIGVEFELIRKFDALSTKYCSRDKQQLWRNKTKNLPQNSSVLSENNPMYGRKQSDKTKELIGNKAKARHDDPEYNQKCKDGAKKFWDSDRGEIRKDEVRQQRKSEANIRKAERDVKMEEYLKLPILETICKHCNIQILSREGNAYCGWKCERSSKYKKNDGFGKHTNSSIGWHRNLWAYLEKILVAYNISEETLFSNLIVYVSLAKKDGIVPKNKGISRKTLLKFKLIEELDDGKIKINHY